MKPIKYRALNNYDTKDASDQATLQGSYGESMTVQSQAEDADINVLMKRYGVTGKMPENPKIPSYGDFTNITDYRGAIEAVRRANEGFMEIPADVRARFNNDPQLLLEAAADDRNRDAFAGLGLLKPKPPTPPQGGEPVAAPAAPTAETKSKEKGGN